MHSSCAHPPSWMSSNGSDSPSLQIMMLPLGRWITRNDCRTAGHLGPVIRLLLPGDWPRAKGSRLPRLRHTRSRAALLCSSSSSTAGAGVVGHSGWVVRGGQLLAQLHHKFAATCWPQAAGQPHPLTQTASAPDTACGCGCSSVSGCRYWSCRASLAPWPQQLKQSRKLLSSCGMGMAARCAAPPASALRTTGVAAAPLGCCGGGRCVCRRCARGIAAPRAHAVTAPASGLPARQGPCTCLLPCCCSARPLPGARALVAGSLLCSRWWGKPESEPQAIRPHLRAAICRRCGVEGRGVGSGRVCRALQRSQPHEAAATSASPATESRPHVSLGQMLICWRISPLNMQDGTSEDEDEEEQGLGEDEADYAEWAAAAEAEFGSLEDAYQELEARLGQARSPAPTPTKPKRANKGLAAAGQLRDAVPQRPRGTSAQPPAPPAGRVQLQLGQYARPPKLAAKPQASSEARAAAQRPLPPPPPPEPKLASKPSRPAAPAAPAPPAKPAAPAPPQPAPQLAAKPAAKPPTGDQQKRALAPEAAVAASKPAPAAVQPAPAKVAEAEQQVPPAEAVAAKPTRVPAAPARPAPQQAAAGTAAAPAEQQQKAAAPAAAPSPAKPKRQPRPAAAAEAQPVAAATKPEAAAPAAVPKPARPTPAASVVEAKPQRPASSPLKLLKEQRLAEERELKAAQAERRAVLALQFKERQERNAAYGHDRLLDRRPETLTVWQANSAGVLVRNDNLSGEWHGMSGMGDCQLPVGLFVLA